MSFFDDFQSNIAQSYFSDPDQRSREDVESSFASLRGTLKSLQVCISCSPLI
jgi:hypothetical protein